MYWNFIKITLRNIANHKLYTSINILGLSIGIACSLIISLYVVHEMTFDRFHKHSERIYRATVTGQIRSIQFNGAPTSGLMAAALREEVDGIEDATRIARFGAWLIASDKMKDNEDNLLFADSNFFDFFSFRLLQGNPDSVLILPNSIVLTETAAQKYFGTQPALGQLLRVEKDTVFYTVTGIVEDAPSNSHIQFDMLASLTTYAKMIERTWLANAIYTYFRVEPGLQQAAVEENLNGLLAKYVFPELQEALDFTMEQFEEENSRFAYKAQTLQSIHLHSDLEGELGLNGKAIYVYSFGVIAFLILVIACMNFMNLSTANSINRAKEIVLRKVSGSDRKTLVVQLLIESVVYSLIALTIALILTELIMPFFNNLLGLHLKTKSIQSIGSFLIVFALTILIGILAGSYPAFFISSFKPIKVLQGILSKGIKNSRVRAVFVVLQFSVSILIIILAIVVSSQVKHMMGKDLGFDKDHVLVIKRPDALGKKLPDFKKEIRNHEGILGVTNSNTIPGRMFNNNTFVLKDTSTVDKNYLLHQIVVKSDFYRTYDLQLLEGTFFIEGDTTNFEKCVINEKTAELLGQDSVLGMVLRQPLLFKSYNKEFEIVGVVKDFHFQSVDKEIEPLIMVYMPGNWEGYLNVKVKPRQLKSVISYLQETWSANTNEFPFQYFFLDDDFNKNYHSLILLERVFVIFSVLAIFVASLGLFGLISYASNLRTKEIGLRKALGASVFQVIVLLVKEVVYLLSFSAVISWGLAYLIAEWWLGQFNYRIEISWFYFFIATLIMFLVAILTVLYQAYKAASKNPCLALKYE